LADGAAVWVSREVWLFWGAAINCVANANAQSTKEIQVRAGCDETVILAS
jgi:hypothetical protein